MDKSKTLVILGAGFQGRQIASMVSDIGSSYEEIILLDDNEEIQKLGSFSTLLNQLVMSRILDSKDLSIDDLISLKSLQMTQSGGFEQFSEQLKYSVFSKIDQALGLDGRFDYVKIRQKLESAQNGSVVEKKEVGGVYEYAKELEKMGDNQ